MSSSIFAVQVQNLSKCYPLYKNPSDRLKQFILPRLQRLVRITPKQYFEEFWALKDVSFKIKKGETVGIIGRNGSGKSTLLQIICGTLTPSSGCVQIQGRVAALLELGSGFNPEFTGRENVYMNAAIMGLRPQEVDARFANIVAFADIGNFIDQPVKTYSSGMMVRLAFAVIAHVDADILVIDEALAVGDAVFIQKCMRFIRRFQKKGALIFVSHDTASVQNLCESGIWLNQGKIEVKGTAKRVSDAYLQFTLQEIYGEESILTPIEKSLVKEDITVDNESPPLIDYGAVATIHNNIETASGWQTDQAQIISISLTHLTSGHENIFTGGERVRLTVLVKAHKALAKPIIGFLFRDRLGQDLFGENTLAFTHLNPSPIAENMSFEGIFEFTLPMLPNGQYALMASIANGDIHEHIQHHWIHDALIITVSSSKIRYGLIGIPFEKAALRTINA